MASMNISKHTHTHTHTHTHPHTHSHLHHHWVEQSIVLAGVAWREGERDGSVEGGFQGHIKRGYHREREVFEGESVRDGDGGEGRVLKRTVTGYCL